MDKIEFELIGDYIYKITETHVPQIIKEEVVMDKKTFIEAFEKWIEKRTWHKLSFSWYDDIIKYNNKEI